MKLYLYLYILTFCSTIHFTASKNRRESWLREEYFTNRLYIGHTLFWFVQIELGSPAVAIGCQATFAMSITIALALACRVSRNVLKHGRLITTSSCGGCGGATDVKSCAVGDIEVVSVGVDIDWRTARSCVDR
jgi:hypothetical protein